MSRVTELANFITQNIDLAKPEALVRLFRQTDSQIFSGYLEYPSIYEEGVENCVQFWVKTIKNALASSDKPVRVVVTGCGTSGLSIFLPV